MSCKSTSGMTGRHLLCRVVRFESIRVDATTFSTPMRNIFLSLLQIDFWYAFPCHKRWFLRPPVSQHHLAANRLPVWRFVNCLWWFAAVWVYWTTLRNTIYIPNSQQIFRSLGGRILTCRKELGTIRKSILDHWHYICIQCTLQNTSQRNFNHPPQALLTS